MMNSTRLPLRFIDYEHALTREGFEEWAQGVDTPFIRTTVRTVSPRHQLLVELWVNLMGEFTVLLCGVEQIKTKDFDEARTKLVYILNEDGKYELTKDGKVKHPKD